MAGVVERAQTHKQLGVVDAVAIIVGIIIGSGIFVAPAGVARAAGGLGLALLLWISAAAVAACGALTYAECASRLPKDGGFFVFYREAFGEWLAFTGGWAAQLVTYPASVAAIAHLCASYVGALVPSLAPHDTVVSVAVIAISGVLNAAGMKTGAATQRLLTAVKIIALLALCVAALWAGEEPLRWRAPDGANGSSAAVFLSALLVLLWTYDGWSDISLVAGELRDPGKMLVRAVVVSMVLLAALYCLVQLAVFSVLPLEEIQASDAVVSDAVQRALGEGAGGGVAALIVLCTFGSLHGIVFTVSRLGSAMARDGDFFRWFAEFDRARSVPLRSLGLMVLASMVYALVADFRELLAFFGQTVWVFYGLAGVSLFVFRRRGVGGASTVRVPTLAPLVLVGSATAITLSLASENPLRFITGIGLVSIGVPVFFLWKALQLRTERR